MARDTRLSDQQYQLVQAVSRLGKARAKDVQLELKHLNLAHTTIATVLSRLETRGVLASELKGRERIFRCKVEESSIRRSMVDSLVSTVFKGDSKALMLHLVSEGEFDPDELEELRKIAKLGAKK